ncbi:hypothetical protein SPRG_06846 [Saprolegnia parasitica CBS 223.65]|uniref:Nudix hydrolase domain-containing protein n=1 Tax=Saprolegnia parasitica (strain CBS 223.65) TaxID=695850 RepID=A0A067CAQ5_SAPPC|nr:hypothetical protein SPRG_06846 [Saprolegnia parasitica CBS 223.65]KDO27578.1 hypothetical protein SPRG_06846 [Saprolegnia parasitica CBS 223.65]|eukprot:XP_012201703.1 hypothetical protein SPRG_06846 [Saprolegnia parasitica CBS 223.65]
MHCFAVVVVRHPRTKRWLAVQETSKHNRLWWLPAGRVENGETFPAAAVRETREEAGIDIRLVGVLRVEHTPIGPQSDRMRIVFYAEPMDVSAPIKTTADDESLGAAWTTVPELQAWADAGQLRDEELLNWAMYLERGGEVAPLSTLGAESSGPEPHMEFRVFFQPSKPGHRYTTLPPAPVEERTDVYIAHSAGVGIKHRSGKRLEIKVRTVDAGEGWEAWGKHRCDDADVNTALARLQLPPLPTPSINVRVQKRRVATVVGGLYLMEETDLVVSVDGDHAAWKTICIEGTRHACERAAEALVHVSLQHEVVFTGGYPAFVRDVVQRRATSQLD